jgi:RimJ/RimL family protein N-acetyltransferase
MTVRARYRGLGIGQELLQKALQDAASAGAVRVHVIVFERNAKAINLYQKMGFRLNPAPELDDKLQGQLQHASGEIIMSIPLSASPQSDGET